MMRPLLRAHILRADGGVTAKRVKSHRAFVHRYGLYAVDPRAVYRLLRWDGNRVEAEGNLAVYFEGNPLPYPLSAGSGEARPETVLADDIFRANLIERLTRARGGKWALPAWMLTVMLIIAVVVIAM